MGIGINLVKSPKIKNYPTTNLSELVNKRIDKRIIEENLKSFFSYWKKCKKELKIKNIIK